MKIRSETELNDFLDTELAWRKKELINLRSFVDKQHGKRTDKTMLRCAVVLLYAQWEGFVKEASKAYLYYVFLLERKYLNLNNNFIALSLKKKLSNLDITSFQLYRNTVDFLLIDANLQNNIEPPNIEIEVDTQSNLNPKVLKEIVSKLGFDYSLYEAKEKPIIDKLLEMRNKIAHGNKEDIVYADYLILHEGVFEMINILKNQIDNAVSLKQYLRKP